MITELVVKARGSQIEAVSVWEQAAVALKLVDKVSTARVGSRIYSQNIGKNSGTGSCGQRRLASQTWDRSCSQPSKSTDDCCLVISCGRALRPEDTGIRQERHCILRITQKTFKRAIEECLVFLDGEADRPAELLTGEGIFYMGTLNIRCRGIKRLAGRQSLADGERIGCIQGIIAEIAEEAAMNLIAAGLGDDVDGRAAGAAQIGSIVAPVDLEFLYRVLAHVQAHAAGIIIHFAAIHRNTIAAAVTSVEGKSALRRLLDAVILVRGEPRGIRNGRSQQGKGQIVAAIDWQVADGLLRHDIGLRASLGFDNRRLCRNFY